LSVRYIDRQILLDLNETWFIDR